MLEIDMFGLLLDIFRPIYQWFLSLLSSILMVAGCGVLLLIIGFFICARSFPFRPNINKLRRLSLKFPLYDLMRWLWVDFLTRADRSNIFSPYGFSIFVGRQGAGKTISMVRYLEIMKQKYPDCLIVTNFSCSFANRKMKSWRDFFEVRNGDKGVIFALDEIHSEYSSADWKDFPESLLSEISQQRKQRVKIVATAQVFSRVAKPIREQAFSVVVCSTWLGRLTMYKEYDAAEYATGDTPYMVKHRCRPISRSFFVQSDRLRQSYDTYEKIERLERTEFLPRAER